MMTKPVTGYAAVDDQSGHIYVSTVSQTERAAKVKALDDHAKEVSIDADFQDDAVNVIFTAWLGDQMTIKPVSVAEIHLTEMDRSNTGRPWYRLRAKASFWLPDGSKVLVLDPDTMIQIVDVKPDIWTGEVVYQGNVETIEVPLHSLGLFDSVEPGDVTNHLPMLDREKSE